MASSSSAFLGFTLHYTGAKFGPNGATLPLSDGKNKTQTKTENLGKIFGNIGALVIRKGISIQQITALIGQIARKNYESSPVERAAKGADQADLFEPGINSTLTCMATAKLEKAAHQTFGKTKVMNERAQPLVHVNKGTLHGELDLWGRMHAAVWHTGINLGPTLSNQGFVYVCCPPGISEEENKKLNEAMAAGKFTVEGNEVVVDGKRLQTCQPKQFYNDKKMVEVKSNGTFQKHGLMINGGPLGWMIHNNNPKIVPQDMVEDLVRTMKIAQGGFYELTKEQQDLVTGGRLKNKNGLGLFEQNQTFNAMFEICGYLEREYGFEPEKLFGHSLTIASKRVTDFFTKHENVDDFLTGPILSEMVQSLRVSGPNSTRKALPLRFTNPFIVTLNNSRAIAHAFDANYNGMPLFRLEALVTDDRYKDILVEGQLALPSLSYGKHAAAILSMAILVSEQMLLEQIFREAFVTGGKEGIADVLRQVLGDKENITELASKIAELIGGINEKDPILGLQFDYCDEIVSTLRSALGTNLLIDLVQKLEQDGILTDEALEQFYKEHGKYEVHEAISHLRSLGQLIQDNPGTTAIKEGSTGINGGLNPLIKKMFPEGVAVDYFQVPGVTREDLNKKAGEAATTTTTVAPVASPTSGTLAANNREGILSHSLNALGGLALGAIETMAANAPLIASVALTSMIPSADTPSL